MPALEAEEAAHRAMGHGHRLVDALASPKVWLLAITNFALLGGIYGISFWMPQIVKDLGVQDVFMNGVVNSIPWIDTGQPYLGQMFVDAIGAGMRAASCPTAYINQVVQPVTGYTRASMEQGGVPYIIPGLRQAVVALRNVAWWSDATRARWSDATRARYAETPPAPACAGRVQARTRSAR